MTPDQNINEVDFIVIGAGSAGCVIASRLSENTDCSVLLVEAGKSDWTHQSRIPAALMRTVGNPRFDWCMTTEPDSSRGNRSDRWARGRLPGGSSALNGLIYLRGSQADFDSPKWADNPGWNWESVLPFYRRLEKWEQSASQERGSVGPVHVEMSRHRYSMTDAFIEAAGNNGIPFNSDINGEQRTGIGYCQTNIRRGIRQSAYDAYIRPHRRRQNLHFFDDCFVSRIVFDNKVATAIEAKHKGLPKTVRARRGIVLSGGTYHSPHLLMLSGVGPQELLRSAEIPVVADRKEVGQNLMDHVGVRMPFVVDGVSANTESRLPVSAVHLIRWLINGQGPIGAPVAQAIAFCGRSDNSPSPELQLTLFPYVRKMTSAGRLTLPPEPYMSLGINLNNPKSKGYLQLSSKNPSDQIQIFPRLLDQAEDIECLLDGIERGRKIVNTKPLSDHVKRVEFPNEPGNKDLDLDFLRENASGFAHPIGTCRMGPDEASVVAPDLKVRGVDNLMVADASIFPQHLTGNINASVMMVGEKAADLIRLQ